MSVIDLSDYRRARATPSRDVTDAITSRDLNDYATVHFICHTDREVVQAGIDYLRASVEAFGPGGWGEFTNPYRHPDGCLYVSNGLTVRFPDEIAFHSEVKP